MDNDEPYPSLSDYHDYEPNLEFDDTELHQTPDTVALAGILFFSHDMYSNDKKNR